MEPNADFAAYAFIFWVPAIAGLFMMVMFWDSGVIRHRETAALWIGSGLVLQLIAPTHSIAWVVGLLLQVAAALYVALQIKLNL